MRFLIIDGDPTSSLSLKLLLENEGFVVDTARDGDRGSYMARTQPYDFILLDYHLPNRSGRQVCADIRGAGSSVPIAGYLSSHDPEHRLELFMVGVDDCVLKDGSSRELLARVRAVLRRAPALQSELLEAAGISLNVWTHQVRVGKRNVFLTRKEFALLELLLRNRGRLLSKLTILEQVWDRNADLDSTTVEAHIFTLRKKLGPAGKKYLRNVPGRGYLLDD